jgi:hypothetical protein
MVMLQQISQGPLNFFSFNKKSEGWHAKFNPQILNAFQSNIFLLQFLLNFL